MSLPGIVSLARHRDDADPQWRWAWDGLVAAYVPALSHVPVGGAMHPAVTAGTGVYMPEGLYRQDATAGAGIQILLTEGARTRLTGLTAVTVLTSFTQRQGASANTYIGGLVYGTSGADPYNTAAFYSNSSGDLFWGYTSPSFQGVDTTINIVNHEPLTALVRQSSGNAVGYANGVERYSASITGLSLATSTTTYLGLGNDASTSSRQMAFDAAATAAWSYDIGARAATALSADPISMFRWRRRIVYSVPTGGTNYTLTADSGSFTLTGTDANLEYGRKLAADSGSFAVTGTDANLEFGRELIADSGAFSVTGTDANLEYGRRLSADSGAFALTGTDANLEFGRLLSADSGAFALTGTDATLIKGTPGAYTLSAESGTFAVTGTDASLECGRRLSADSGAFALTGTDATLVYGTVGSYTLAAETGTFALTGTDATLTCGRRIAADGGTYAVTGTDATLVRPYRLTADSGAFVVTGTAAGLLYSAANSTALRAARRSGVRYLITPRPRP